MTVDVKISDPIKREAFFYFDTYVEGERDWTLRANCMGMDTNAFFPTNRHSANMIYAQLRVVCGGCEVRMDCLEYALKHDERRGFWGGKTERERNRGKGRQKCLDEIAKWKAEREVG